MKRHLFGRGGDNSAAVAPIVALSLFALIGAGGIAFDYSRIATLDTELQQAADQAALAAATQLDRSDGAQARASAAITDDDGTKRLAANFTRFANDGDDDGTAVELPTITFCSEFDDDVQDTTAACTTTDEDTEARFVVVTTQVRTAEYALTPIVGAFVGDAHATAVAGVESSICNVAPLLVCVPSDDFPTEADVGKGIVLKPLDGISGNYGLLDFGKGTGDVTKALLGHGLNGCQNQDDNETEPGTKTPVTDAINTRMDVYAHNNNNVWDNQSKTPKCNLADGTGCPSPNSTKDMVLKYIVTLNNTTSTTPPAAAACPATPDMSTLEFVAPETPVVGYNRDQCHYSGTCGSGLAGNIGDGEWNRTAYFAQYHGGDATAAAAFAGKAANELTRYDVYRWESDDLATRLTTQRQVTTVKTTRNNGRFDYTVTSQCTYPKPITASSAYPPEKDRRVLPIVAANCDKLKGKGQAFEDYVILRVFDVFLTEPSQTRTYPGPTDEKEIYGEVIGPAQPQGGGGGFQYYSRSRPYLVR